MEMNFNENQLQQAKNMAGSPTGKHLMEMLKQMDAGTLEKAMAQASSGDYSGIAETLAPLLASEDVKALLKQLGG